MSLQSLVLKFIIEELDFPAKSFLLDSRVFEHNTLLTYRLRVEESAES